MHKQRVFVQLIYPKSKVGPFSCLFSLSLTPVINALGNMNQMFQRENFFMHADVAINGIFIVGGYSLVNCMNHHLLN